MKHSAETYLAATKAFRDHIEGLNSELDDLSTIPQGLTLPDLLAVREMFVGRRARSYRESADARERYVEVVGSALRRGETLVPDLCNRLGDKIASLVYHSTSEELDAIGVIRTRDFGEVGQIYFENRGGLTLYVGALHNLPPTHPFLRRLNPADAYQSHNDYAVAVLGASGRAALPWYWIDETLAYTRQWRRPQVEAEQRRREDEAREKVHREETWRNSPAGVEAAKNQRIAELERRVVELEAAKK